MPDDFLAAHHPQGQRAKFDTMSPEEGKRAVRRACILSGIGIALFLWFALAPALFEEFGSHLRKGGWSDILESILTLRLYSLYLFQPWMFPGITGLPGLIIVPFLTYFVHRRNQVAAVLLLSLYLLLRVFIVLWLYPYPYSFIATWLVVSLAWGYLLFQGVRGTFAHHWNRFESRGVL